MLEPILLILVTMMFSAFFSGMEIAYVSANKLQAELNKSKGVFASGMVSFLLKRPGYYIATMLVGNNTALVFYGIFMAALLGPLFMQFTENSAAILVSQTIVSTFVILIAAEFLPKTLFRQNPNRALSIFALPVYVFYYLFFPITYVSVLLSHTIMRYVLKIPVAREKDTIVFGKPDLDNLITEKINSPSNQLVDNELRIFQNALEFSEVRVRECMIPRTELETIEVNKSIEEITQKFIESGYSKILVYHKNIDNIIGYFHSTKLFLKPKNIREQLTPIEIVPETMQAKKLLSKFIQEHLSLAVVVDEFGGTSGIVSTEDIIEEILGEIRDEHDTVDLTEKQINDKEFLLSGRVEIDHINENYKLTLPESDEYETIAGFILSKHNNIPRPNETINLGKYRFIIKEATSTRIELVNMKIIDTE